MRQPPRPARARRCRAISRRSCAARCARCCADHDVFITDWHNARDVALSHGRFGLDEYVEHLIGFLAAIGPGTHVVAVCQPCVPALAAAAIMAEDDHPARRAA